MSAIEDMDTVEAELRAELSLYAKKIVAGGLVVGPGGNLSARSGDDLLVSPSGFDLAEVTPGDWVAIDIGSGEPAPSSLRPSSETAMHLSVYRQHAHVMALIHTHPVHCIAISTVRTSMPMLFPDQAALVGEVAFVDYMLPTTEDMGDSVAGALGQESSAVILANHGLVTTGHNLREAYYRTQVVEAAASITLLASNVAEPRGLDAHQTKAIRDLEWEAHRIKLLQGQG